MSFAEPFWRYRQGKDRWRATNPILKAVLFLLIVLSVLSSNVFGTLFGLVMVLAATWLRVGSRHIDLVMSFIVGGVLAYLIFVPARELLTPFLPVRPIPILGATVQPLVVVAGLLAAPALFLMGSRLGARDYGWLIEFCPSPCRRLVACYLHGVGFGLVNLPSVVSTAQRRVRSRGGVRPYSLGDVLRYRRETSQWPPPVRAMELFIDMLLQPISELIDTVWHTVNARVSLRYRSQTLRTFAPIDGTFASLCFVLMLDVVYHW